MVDHLINDLAELRRDGSRIVTMNARNQVRALADVRLVLVAPLDPFVIPVAWFHA
jgi:hypothetical protein